MSAPASGTATLTLTAAGGSQVLLTGGNVDGTTWSAPSVTVATGLAAPDGTTTAFSLTYPVDAIDHYAVPSYNFQASELQSTTYTFGAWLRSADGNALPIRVSIEDFNDVGPSGGGYALVSVPGVWTYFTNSLTTGTKPNAYPLLYSFSGEAAGRTVEVWRPSFNSGGVAGQVGASASLSLTATAAANAPATGTATVALSATAAASAPDTATATVTVTATGSGSAPASGTAVVALSGSAAAAAAGTGAGVMQLSAAGTAKAVGTGSAVVQLSGSGAARGAGAGSGTFSVVATGTLVAQANAQALLALSATGSAFVPLGAGQPVSNPTLTLTLADTTDTSLTLGNGTATLTLTSPDSTLEMT